MCRILALVILTFLVPSPLTAQSDALIESQLAYRQLLTDGMAAEGETLAGRTLERAVAELGEVHQFTATVLGDLAGLYFHQERFAEAEPLFLRSLEIEEALFGADSPKLTPKLFNLARLRQMQGRYGQAEILYRRVVAIDEAHFGVVHEEVAVDLTELGLMLSKQGRDVEAEHMLLRALSIREVVQEEMSIEIAQSLENISQLYLPQGRLEEALPLYERSVEIYQAVLGANHPYIAAWLFNLGDIYRALGRIDEAAERYKSAIEVDESVLGPNDLEVALDLDHFAGMFIEQGRFVDAEPLLERAYYIRDATLDPMDPALAAPLIELSEIYRLRHRFELAEPILIRALAITEDGFGSGSFEVAAVLARLGAAYRDMGRFADAELHLRRGLWNGELALGGEDSRIAPLLNDLAILYQRQGRYEEAEPLLDRALSLSERDGDRAATATSLLTIGQLNQAQGRHVEASGYYGRALEFRVGLYGKEHPFVAEVIHNAGQLHFREGRNNEAENLHQHALSIYVSAFGPDHPVVASVLHDLGMVYQRQDRLMEADQAFMESLAIAYASYGENDPRGAPTLARLALVKSRLGEPVKAEELLLHALNIQRETYGTSHPLVVSLLLELTVFYSGLDRNLDALSASRLALAVLSLREVELNDQFSIGAESARIARHWVYRNHLHLMARAQDSGEIEDAAHLNEGFFYGQQAQASGVGRALARAALRVVSGDAALAKLIRRQQDLREHERALEAKLTNAQLAGAVDIAANIRDAALQTRSQMDEILGRIEEEFPKYSELAAPRPTPLSHIGPLIGPDEVLLSFVFDEQGGHLWAVRQDEAAYFPLSVTSSEIGRTVAILRESLDPTERAGLRGYPAGRAYDLYRKLLEPAAAILKGVDHLLVVSDGALQSLPLGTLMMEKPSKPRLLGPDELRSAPWLARRFSVTVLPAIGSLKALRGLPRTITVERKPVIGFGDPVLDGEASNGRGIDALTLFSEYRTNFADVDAVRNLPRLPETAMELRTLAKTLGADEGDIHLGAAATERMVKALDLSDRRVVAFATHGLVVGDFEEVGEPALVLTPPDEASEEDDGLLTAGEVAQLKLNADWVVLSACNTAAADGSPGAEGLSGLAKAFFYAGARTLLVSHWPVETNAAAALTTRLFEYQAEHPGEGGAEALRQARLGLMNDPDNPHFAHPLFWAPFVPVGEGGNYRPSVD